MLNETTESLVIVGEVTEAHCRLAAALNQSSLLLSIAVTHMFVAVCGLVAFYKYFQTKPVRKAVGLVGANLKIISVFGYFYYFWGFISALSVSLYKVISYIYLRYLEPCQYVLSGTVCYVAYSQHNSACTIAYTSFHIALLLERLYSTFLDPIREHPPLFGVIVGLIIFVSPQCIMFFYFYPLYLKKGFIYDRLYCAGIVNNSGASNALILRLMITFLIIDFLEPSSDPEIDQFWREIINLIRTFNNFLVFLALCLLHRQQRTIPSDYTRNENETDRYFQQFNQMIA
ncbi:hypothetical protein M3Y98_00712700 [Aphelenchoides besseyi]|nr:hypothetical protein M3Y98_00712700 [Aphelenchoides besseyi]KAI6210314.1 hypothetical protein M3Y96_00314900 [Aphelenchoides besseyi]